jgi:hypothetical protein
MEKVKLNIEIEISVDDYNDMIEKIKLDNVGSSKKDIEDIIKGNIELDLNILGGELFINNCYYN